MTHTPRCSRCKRPLKDPVSIALGMGPECRGSLSRKGWKFPRPKWKVQGGRAVLMGFEGKIEEPPIGDLTEKKRKKVKDDRNKHES